MNSRSRPENSRNTIPSTPALSRARQTMSISRPTTSPTKQVPLNRASSTARPAADSLARSRRMAAKRLSAQTMKPCPVVTCPARWDSSRWVWALMSPGTMVTAPGRAARRDRPLHATDPQQGSGHPGSEPPSKNSGQAGSMVRMHPARIASVTLPLTCQKPNKKEAAEPPLGNALKRPLIHRSGRRPA